MDHHCICRGLMTACVVMVMVGEIRAGLTADSQSDAPQANVVQHVDQAVATPVADPRISVDPVPSNVEIPAPQSLNDSTLVPAVAALDAQTLQSGNHGGFFWGGWADRSTGPARHIELWEDFPRAALSSGADEVPDSTQALIDDEPSPGAIIPLPTPVLSGLATLAVVGAVAWIRSHRSRSR